ncbi:MAG: hypothetical protein MHM6MM_000651 [Cercozoa sp. M6MM]
MEALQVVTPGERLGSVDEFQAGVGTFKRSGHIFAGVLGRQVCAEGEIKVLARKQVQRTPAVGDTVLARITKIGERAAHAEILCVGDESLRETFVGMVRQHDVRQTDVDAVEMHECFVPGDVIRAKVISLGNQRNYYLSTAANELGVLLARSAATGEQMVPISWRHMQCPLTKSKEPRKVACTLPEQQIRDASEEETRIQELES